MCRLTPCIALAALAAIAGAVLGGAWLPLHYVAKPLATLLVGVMAWRARPAIAPGYRRAVLCGIALSLAGDVCLMLPVDAFVPGLVAFLLAHACYITAFRRHVGWRGLGLAVPLLGAYAAINLVGLWRWLPPSLQLPVLAYVVVLCAMATLALARAWARPPVCADEARSARFAAVGALLFVASDSVLAWDRFASGIGLAPLWILATYYAAQWCIARSVSTAETPAG